MDQAVKFHCINENTTGINVMFKKTTVYMNVTQSKIFGSRSFSARIFREPRTHHTLKLQDVTFPLVSQITHKQAGNSPNCTIIPRDEPSYQYGCISLIPGKVGDVPLLGGSLSSLLAHLRAGRPRPPPPFTEAPPQNSEFINSQECEKNTIKICFFWGGGCCERSNI